MPMVCMWRRGVHAVHAVHGAHASPSFGEMKTTHACLLAYRLTCLLPNLPTATCLPP